MAEKKSDHLDETNITKSEFPQESVQETENLHLKTRRRLIQAGLVSLPVLMTVRSRPALAQSLGSVDIPYGAYLVDKDGVLIRDGAGNLIPIKVNEYGEPVDVDGKVIDQFVHPNKQEILNDPTRRVDEGSTTYNPSYDPNPE